MAIKSFDDLDITDPIMFGLVFSNTHIAKPFIEHLLGIEIDHLETPTPEAVLSYDAEHKGVRYDVFARETNENGKTIRSFDLEMQIQKCSIRPWLTKKLRVVSITWEATILCLI